jgi:hypothetical protein
MEDEKLPVKPTLKRINSAYIWHEFQHIFHFEKGFLYTMKGLMFQPGKTVISTVVTLIFKYIGENMYFFSTEQFHNRKIVVKIYEWFNNNIGYTFLILGIHLTFWTKLFFRKHPYNFWELLITFCYYIGQALFIIFILTIALKYTRLSFKEELDKYVGFAYLFWATGQFFGEKKLINYVKSTFAIIIGGLSFTLITEVLVQLVDLLIEKAKH